MLEEWGVKGSKVEQKAKQNLKTMKEIEYWTRTGL